MMEVTPAALEGRDLSEELVVQTLHLLFLTGRIFSITCCLLLLAIEQGLLLCHLLPHVGEYLEELGFIH